MERKHHPSLGVYVLTSSGYVAGRGHLEVALAAVDGGANAVQLRAPELGDPELLALASEIASACRAAGALFLVNDRIEMALASGADGVHLGQGDLEGEPRERLGPEALLGISVETPGQASAAEAAGADYVAVTVWATPTKPEARPRGLEGLREVVAATSLPVVGIGGIHLGNVMEVLDAGAEGVAVISAVGAMPDPVAATRELGDVVRRWKAGDRGLEKRARTRER